jgi:nitrate reductase gamma subunit
MKDIFNGREEIAKATNTLFKIGFYLMNLGFALYILTITAEKISTQEAIEILSMKVGGFSIYLGLMLFFNMYLLFRGKRVAREKRLITQGTVKA